MSAPQLAFSKPRLKQFLAFSLFLSLFIGTVRADTLPKVPCEPVKNALNSFVEKQILGGAVALVATGDKVLCFESVGFCELAHKTPMRLDNTFYLASMTKTFTGVALMMLVDEGKVNLDDPVEKFLPEFKGQMVADENDKEHPHPPQHPVTVRELMCHTHGLTELGNKAVYNLKGDTLTVAKNPLTREPGTKFKYSNMGINTAGRIIEVVSGMSYGDFVQKRILAPLKMTDATFWPTADQAKRLAKSTKAKEDKAGLEDINFTFKPDPLVPSEMATQLNGSINTIYANHYAMPAGGLFSTASDLLPFCQMLLNGGVYHGQRYLSENAFTQFSSPQNGAAVKSATEAYGVGCYVEIKSGPGLPSVGAFGHRGARGTMMWVDPSRRLVFILLMQAWNAPTGKEQEAITSSFFKAVYELADKSAGK